MFYLKQFAEIWLLPPNNSFLLCLIGLLLWKYRWPVLGQTIVVTSVAFLWLMSTPFVAQQLLDRLQNKYQPLLPSQLKIDKDAAIVVLEGGLNTQTPEYGNVATVSEGTLTRIRYAAFLHAKTKAPILVSGNDPTHLSMNQADFMADSLKTYFNTPTQWKEASGYNTAQEGILSAAILKKDGVKKIYLVTHALHMPRSVYAFQNKGLEIIPAPTGYRDIGRNLGKLSNYIPSVDALSASYAALHEYIGILWYSLYYRF